jgi:hypothetical protein
MTTAFERRVRVNAAAVIAYEATSAKAIHASGELDADVAIPTLAVLAWVVIVHD